jgi:putative peptide zinc metalloprotease protein
VSWAWWPHPGTYQPIGPDERGRLTALLPTQDPADTVPDRGLATTAFLPVGAAAEQRLSVDKPLGATFASPSAVPTRDEPRLAVVLVPRDPDHAGPSDGPDNGSLPSDDTADPWVFPFSQPLPPEEGDNQALAINTADDSVVYDVAFALVWADGDEVLNVNEAHAYASCNRCVTVAVAFQVVLIVDDAQVVVPQNLSVAANYECFQCVTAALASQLVLSVPGAPTEQQLTSLAAVWDRLLELGHDITAYSLGAIAAALDDIQSQIVEILGTDAVEAEATDTASTTPDETATTPSETPTSSTTDPSSPSATPSPADSATTSATPTDTTSPTPTTTSPSPTSTTSTSPTSPTSSTSTPSPTTTPSPTP